MCRTMELKIDKNELIKYHKVAKNIIIQDNNFSSILTFISYYLIIFFGRV